MASTLPRPPNARSPSEQPTHSPSEPSARLHCDTHNAQRPARVCSRHRRTAQLPPVQPARTPMAANPPVVAVEYFRVEHGDGLSMPVISLTDRRAAGNRLVRFVFQRHLEAILYGRAEGSSGPIYKLLASSGMGSTTLTVNKQAVTDGTITQDEYTAIMSTFKAALPPSVVDPSSLGRIRYCTRESHDGASQSACGFHAAGGREISLAGGRGDLAPPPRPGRAGERPGARARAPPSCGAALCAR